MDTCVRTSSWRIWRVVIPVAVIVAGIAWAQRRAPAVPPALHRSAYSVPSREKLGECWPLDDGDVAMMTSKGPACWTPSTGAVKPLPGPVSPVWCVTPGGRVAWMTGTSSVEVRSFPSSEGVAQDKAQVSLSLSALRRLDVECMRLTPDGSRLVIVCDQDEPVATKMFSIDVKQKRVATIDVDETLSDWQAVAVSSDGSLVAVGYIGSVVVYDTASLAPRYRVRTGDSERSVAFSANGDVVCACDGHLTIGHTKVPEGSLYGLPYSEWARLKREFTNLRVAAYLPDWECIVVMDDHGKLGILKDSGGSHGYRLVAVEDFLHLRFVAWCRLSDRGVLLVGTYSGSVERYDLGSMLKWLGLPTGRQATK